MILVAIVCFTVSVNAESGNYCNQDGSRRLELYNDAYFQLKERGKNPITGTYEITSDNVIIFRYSDGREYRGRFHRAIRERSGVLRSPAAITYFEDQLVKNACK